MTIRQALISVSDKTGVVDFARELNSLKVNIISSGGTAKELKKNRIDCREITDVTGFPEILDGRVKTLNPRIHGGILARRDRKAHLEELKKHDIEPIDIVVVNLYPFEATIAKMPDADLKKVTDDVIENIDIGGVALIRAAAKNFNDVLIVCEPSDYAVIIEKIKKNEITPEFRRELAAKAFRHTAYYDGIISSYFTLEKFPDHMVLPLARLSSLRYGENPHQQAAVYRQGVPTDKPAAVTARQLQGKELSYNNYLDLEASWRLVLEFDKPACAIIKHNNPCGCAQSSAGILDAYKKALACDTASAYGGIIAFNREVDDATAADVTKLFSECVIAPSFTEKAKQVFAAKKNLRLLEQPAKIKKDQGTVEIDYRSLTGGILVQDKDAALLTEKKPATKRAPTKEEMDALMFAWVVCKHVKSNAIILVRGEQTVGIGAGQMSRIDSLNIAAEKMKAVNHGLDEKKFPLVLASDAFFPFNDVPLTAAKVGVTAIAQPGGSIRDADSIKACDENNVAMIFTGMRHFRH
jgi:phosphoribosylaminoimidazolecarboxamide formyltransferase/IMP cyclohydrolase